METQSKRKPNAPMLSVAQLLQAQKEETLLSDRTADHLILDGLDLSRLRLERICFSHCSFQNCDWTGTDFSAVIFDGCDLSGSRLEAVRLEKTEFADCKLLGAVWLSADLIRCGFRACALQSQNFASCRWKDCRSEQSDWSDSAFQETEIKKWTTTKDLLYGVSFFHTQLAGTDFRQDETEGWRVSAHFTELKGAVFTPVQAAGLSALLGIHIAAPEEPLPAETQKQRSAKKSR